MALWSRVLKLIKKISNLMRKKNKSYRLRITSRRGKSNPTYRNWTHWKRRKLIRGKWLKSVRKNKATVIVTLHLAHPLIRRQIQAITKGTHNPMTHLLHHQTATQNPHPHQALTPKSGTLSRKWKGSKKKRNTRSTTSKNLSLNYLKSKKKERDVNIDKEKLRGS